MFRFQELNVDNVNAMVEYLCVTYKVTILLDHDYPYHIYNIGDARDHQGDWFYADEPTVFVPKNSTLECVVMDILDGVAQHVLGDEFGRIHQITFSHKVWALDKAKEFFPKIDHEKMYEYACYNIKDILKP